MSDLLPDGTTLQLYLLLLPFLGVFLVGVYRLWRRLGGAELAAEILPIGRSGGPLRPPPTARGAASRLRRLLDYGLLQSRVLERSRSGWIHAAILWGFLGLLLGDVVLFTDRFLLPPLGVRFLEGSTDVVFQATLEVFGIVFLAGLVGALARRLVWKPPHLGASREATLILLGLLFIGVSGFVVEGLRVGLQPGASGSGVFVGRAVGLALAGAGAADETSLLTYRVVWWVHALAAFGFIAALPYTRLAHLLASPLYLLAAPARPLGQLSTPFDLREVIESGNFDVKVGAGKVDDLCAADRLALVACTECGRCQQACPAHATGTALSPKGLLQDLKGMWNGSNGNARAQDVFDGAVSEQAVWACTMCGACARQCPVLIRPLDHIIQLRRELVARNRVVPKGAAMLGNLARTQNPYGLPHADRERLAGDLGVATLRENADVEFLYWIGCAATYDPRSRQIARSMVRILKGAGVPFGILGPEERCSGDPARRLGEEGKFQELALQNLETFERYKVARILTHCAHCYNTFKNEYTEFGGRFEVVHHTTLLRDLISSGRTRMVRPQAGTVTVHDACYLGRLNGEVGAPRQILSAIAGLHTAEMPQNRQNSFCCGAGGARYWYDSDISSRERISVTRVREAIGCGAQTVVSECPYCLRMFEDARVAGGLGDQLMFRDVAELVAEALD